MNDLHIPMRRIGTTIRLPKGGGFDVRGCPDGEILAAVIERAVNAHDELIAALKRALDEAVADEMDDWYANALAVVKKWESM